jgi:hypothetical protein
LHFSSNSIIISPLGIGAERVIIVVRRLETRLTSQRIADEGGPFPAAARLLLDSKGIHIRAEARTPPPAEPEEYVVLPIKTLDRDRFTERVKERGAWTERGRLSGGKAPASGFTNDTPTGEAWVNLLAEYESMCYLADEFANNTFAETNAPYLRSVNEVLYGQRHIAAAVIESVGDPDEARRLYSELQAVTGIEDLTWELMLEPIATIAP